MSTAVQERPTTLAPAAPPRPRVEPIPGGESYVDRTVVPTRVLPAISIITEAIVREAERRQVKDLMPSELCDQQQADLVARLREYFAHN